MTQREFLEVVANGVGKVSYKNGEDTVFKTVGIDDPDIKEYAKSAIEKLNTKNEKRKTSGSKIAKENEPIKANIVKIFEDNPQTVFTAKNIAEKVGISPQKSSALLRQIVDTGRVDSFVVKDEKKNKVKGYQFKGE